MFLPGPSLITGDMKTTLSPGRLVPAGMVIASSAGFEVPEDLGYFFRVELHFNLAWELGLPLRGALYLSGNASCLANAHSALEFCSAGGGLTSASLPWLVSARDMCRNTVG